MTEPLYLHLSRRESQIMDVIFQLGEATVAEVVDRMPDQPGYNTVRNTMAILEKKGHLEHRQEGQRYVYRAVEGEEKVRRSAVSHLVNTFFHGSLPQAVQAMLGTSPNRLSREDLDEIADYIDKARQEAK